MTEDEAANAFYRLLFQHVEERYAELKGSNGRLAHYTSAENALNIISGPSVWLRNSALMNDFMEIAYGKSCLVPALQASVHEIEAALRVHHDGLVAEVIEWLSEVEFTVNTQTYLTSLAVHPENDELGKLSMWRAYGGPVAGVALVFNLDVFETESAALNAFTLPVLYGPEEFLKVFNAIVQNVSAAGEVLAFLPRARAKSILFHALQDLVLTTKHPGFREEEEWRVIHSPFMFGSAYIRPIVKSIGGIPQVVHVLELRDQPNLNMPELELDRLIRKVIIGPCQYPEQVAFAIHEALAERGVANPRERIKVSTIPLRQRG